MEPIQNIGPREALDAPQIHFQTKIRAALKSTIIPTKWLRYLTYHWAQQVLLNDYFAGRGVHPFSCYVLLQIRRYLEGHIALSSLNIVHLRILHTDEYQDADAGGIYLYNPFPSKVKMLPDVVLSATMQDAHAAAINTANDGMSHSSELFHQAGLPKADEEIAKPVIDAIRIIMDKYGKQ